MAAVPQDHVEEDHGHLWIARLLEDAFNSQAIIDHWVGTSSRELVVPEVDGRVFPACPRVVERVLGVRRRVGIDRPELLVQDQRALVTKGPAAEQAAQVLLLGGKFELPVCQGVALVLLHRGPVRQADRLGRGFF